jgi:hypothetical protein
MPFAGWDKSTCKMFLTSFSNSLHEIYTWVKTMLKNPRRLLCCCSMKQWACIGGWSASTAERSPGIHVHLTTTGRSIQTSVYTRVGLALFPIQIPTQREPRYIQGFDFTAILASAGGPENIQGLVKIFSTFDFWWRMDNDKSKFFIQSRWDGRAV